MILTLSQQLAAALESNRCLRVEFVDPASQRSDARVDSETQQRAMEALQRQQDKAAIERGLAEADAGMVSDLDKAFDRICSELGLPLQP